MSFHVSLGSVTWLVSWSEEHNAFLVSIESAEENEHLRSEQDDVG